MLTDAELIKSYAQDRSETAFTELVNRHINLVYSAALREAGGRTALAEDITQAVFAEVARKPGRLCGHPALAGWLYTSVRRVGANQRRAEERRQRREQAAYSMNELLSPDPSATDWQQIRPVLDDVMHELGETDRAAVVLRFFEDRSLKEVGEALGLNENAARMRVDRALDKLRKLLASRGIRSTTASLAAGLAAAVVMAAPAGLAASVATGALAGAGATSTTLSTLELIKLMTMTKLQMGAAGALIVAAIAVPVWQETRLHHLAEENKQLQAAVEAARPTRQEAARLRQVNVDHTELERLRQSEKQLQTEVLQLRGRVGRANRSEAENAQLQTALQQAKQTLEAANTNEVTTAMSSMVKSVIEQQVQGQMGRMKAKLNLSSDQEQAIRNILMAQADRTSSAAQKLLSGKLTKEEMASLNQTTGNPEEQIKALLSPAQLTAYQDYKQDEKISNARMAANAEIMQMQNVLGLTQEQQDKAFPLLYEQTLQQLTNAAAATTPKTSNQVAVMEQYFDGKIRALQGVLTPAQLDSYRQFQASQLKMMKTMMPQEGSAGTPGKP